MLNTLIGGTAAFACGPLRRNRREISCGIVFLSGGQFKNADDVVNQRVHTLFDVGFADTGGWWSIRQATLRPTGK